MALWGCWGRVEEWRYNKHYNLHTCDVLGSRRRRRRRILCKENREEKKKRGSVVLSSFAPKSGFGSSDASNSSHPIHLTSVPFRSLHVLGAFCFFKSFVESYHFNSIIIWVGKGEGAFHVEIFYLFTGDWLLRINSLKLKSVKK